MGTESIKLKEEIKPIIEAINNLECWDKSDLINYLILSQTEKDFETTREIFSDCELDEDECIDNVIYNNNETQILDKMNITEIVDYILECGSYDKNKALNHLFNYLGEEDLIDAVEAEDIQKILHYIKHDRPDEMLKWLKKALDLYEK